ncbi:MAG: hypothetical protein AAF664_22875, partial [Planctomycetota bacterium]
PFFSARLEVLLEYHLGLIGVGVTHFRWGVIRLGIRQHGVGQGSGDQQRRDEAAAIAEDGSTRKTSTSGAKQNGTIRGTG